MRTFLSAVFSDCKRYRYRLGRSIDMFGGPVIGFCLHNPSTANEAIDDRTSRRGIGYARLWQASRLIYVNAWAGIATLPAQLWKMEDPVGPDNDQHIAEAAAEIASSGGFIVAAWGSIKPPSRQRAAALARLEKTEDLIRAQGCELRALGVNSDGSPKHPLYVKTAAIPMPWNER